MATTVILIRHGDRDIPMIGTDPPLNDRGMTRARELVHVLSAADIRAIYTSDARRAIMTASLFSFVHPELPVVQLRDAPDLRDHILENHQGETVLVVGHANTVPELIRLLGGPSLPDINDCVFDNLFVLVRHSDTEASLTNLKYGEPTPPG
ncbi:MAG TPA: phosphoglycerate mutase family protein [Pyrinomonadaceae bacterium]